MCIYCHVIDKKTFLLNAAAGSMMLSVNIPFGHILEIELLKLALSPVEMNNFLDSLVIEVIFQTELSNILDF